LLKNLRARAIKGRGAPIPRVGVWVVDVKGYVFLGMSLATVTDRSCYRQDDLNPEEMYRYVFLERSANACSEALYSGRLEDSRRFASVYLTLFPAYCIMHSLLRNELSDVDRHTLLSFAFALGMLWHRGFLVCSKLPEASPNSEDEIGGRGEAKGQYRTLFDVDGLVGW
jgi:hypothetical protein